MVPSIGRYDERHLRGHRQLHTLIYLVRTESKAYGGTANISLRLRSISS
jgi:hypothetical protein